MHQLLQQKLLAAFSSPLSLDTCAFQALSHEVFTYQYHANLPYRRYAQLCGITPTTLASWQDIPHLPTDVFKIPSHGLTTQPDCTPKACFMTSGTTQETKGTHVLSDTSLYEASILSMWKAQHAPFPDTALFCILPPHLAPHSSLSFMMGVLAKNAFKQSEWLLNSQGEIAIEKLKKKHPFLLFATTISLLYLMEQSPAPIPLPEGSFLFETGGYKGLKTSFSKETLYAKLSAFFSLPPSHILSEYSMTELSSQAYARSVQGTYHFPPWVGITVIDPITQETCPPERIGQLHILDLANLFSVSAIATQDCARLLEDGRFELLGRNPKALTPRGCSRAADALHQSLHTHLP